MLLGREHFVEQEDAPRRREERITGAHELGALRLDDTPSRASAPTHSPNKPRAPRLRVMTYNVGGLCATSYDVLCDWLLKQDAHDVVILQELHHGCGKHENRWRIGPWTALVSPDDKNRYSGVGVFIHSRVAEDS